MKESRNFPNWTLILLTKFCWTTAEKTGMGQIEEMLWREKGENSVLDLWLQDFASWVAQDVFPTSAHLTMNLRFFYNSGFPGIFSMRHNVVSFRNISNFLTQTQIACLISCKSLILSEMMVCHSQLKLISAQNFKYFFGAYTFSIYPSTLKPNHELIGQKALLGWSLSPTKHLP